MFALYSIVVLMCRLGCAHAFVVASLCQCAVEALFVFICALQRLEVNEFSVVLFGSDVKIIKSGTCFVSVSLRLQAPSLLLPV